jgi:uroporphyrin-3 C-methyltransferase
MPSEEKKLSKTDSNNKSNSEPVQNKKSTGFGFLFFLLMLSIGVSLAAAYYLWAYQQKQTTELNLQLQAIQQLKSELQKTSAEYKRNSDAVGKNAIQIKKLTAQIVQTEEISQRAIEIVNRSQRGWALAEIDYLLRIAHQRIAVAKDIAGAIAALKGADARIEQLGDLNLFKVRKQLAKDIANLNSVHQADVNGITLSLDQIITYLPELPFKSVKDEIKVQFTENDVVEQPEEKDKTFVDSVIETVKQIGEIKIHQRSIQAASNADQQNSIEQLLRTYLLGARLAALRFDQTQFLHEINQASELLRLHYEASDNRIEQLQKTLLGYSALQLNPDLPELTRSWTLLQEEINKTVKQEQQQ